MVQPMGQEFLHTADVIDGFLKRLEKLSISPLPRQSQALEPLNLQSVSIDEELQKSALPDNVKSSLRSAFKDAADTLDGFFQSKWQATLSEWHGQAPGDGFSSLADSFQEMHRRHTQKLKHQCCSALERHKLSFRPEQNSRVSLLMLIPTLINTHVSTAAGHSL